MKTFQSPSSNDLPGWINWLAQDANGGWWGYETEPHQASSNWYENEIGRYLRVSMEKPNPDWRISLHRR